MRLFAAEKFVILISSTLFILDGLLLAYKGVGIDIIGYAIALTIGFFSLGLGQFYRSYRENEGIALATTACGLYIVFTLVASVFNYLLLPNHSPMIDPLLIRMDAALGYSWTNFVVWTAQWPWLGTVFRAVYISSMAQLILVILILGFTGKRDDLHRFLLTGVLGGILTICTWAFFPSSGASGWEVLPAQAQGALPIMVNSDYGMELNRLAREGVTYISPQNVLGLIGFPSFHTVMACLSVWYMARFKWVFPIFLVINLLMLPSVLVQGGHHLSDVLGGLAVFAIATVLARRILAQSSLATGSSEARTISASLPH
jgi:PAP2 superfamily